MKRILAILILGAAALLAQESSSEGAGKGEDGNYWWKWANFVILAGGLGYLIGKNAPGMFKARTADIQKGIAEAQQVKRDADKRAADVDAKVQRLGADIQAFRAQAKTEMEREGERIRQDTAAQIQKIQQQAELEIESAGKTARRELREYASGLAMELATERIRARMTPSADAALITDFVQDLGQHANKN
jgi:F-type H+-transporting ATPase subunit b